MGKIQLRVGDNGPFIPHVPKVRPEVKHANHTANEVARTITLRK